MTSKLHPAAELVTAADTDREVWLDRRAQGITATDLPAIMGTSKYRTALDVWQDKLDRLTGTAPGVEPELHESAKWGHRLEGPVAEEWCARTGLGVRRLGMLANIERPWMLASLDRRVVSCELGMPCALEVKTRTLHVGPQWDAGLPEDVRLQVQWQLAVSGMHHVHVIALIGGQRLVEHVEHPDPDLHGRMIEAASIVHKAVHDGLPPDMPVELWTAAYVEARHPDRTGERELDPRAAQLVELLRELAADEAQLSTERDRVRTELVGLLGDGEVGLLDGRPVFTYKASSSRRLSSKQLEALYPEVAADERLWSSSSYRTFRLTTTKD